MTAGDASRNTELNALIAGATQRNRKRNRDMSRLQCAEKRDDVVKPLWCQYDRAVTRRPAMFELPCNVQCSPIHLRPRQAFGNAVPFLLVVNKRERRVIGLQTGALAQHSRNGRLNHLHEATVAIAAAPWKEKLK